ncbi:MAG: hypothetical protein WBA31_11070 [Candidatus Dormiibacterota bacterium]
MSDVAAPPTPSVGLGFGDVCAGKFLADVRANSETIPVFTVPDAGHIFSFPVYRQSSRETNRLVVTAGQRQTRAVVVSDSCSVETALGRGARKARGRIWFAPIRKLSKPGELKEIEDTPDAYGRLLLRADADSEHRWVVELQNAFPVEASSVRQAVELADQHFVLYTIEPDEADNLRARWAAVGVRCGPLVARDNTEHLLDALEAHGVPSAQAMRVATALVGVAAAGWVLEGSSLEAAGDLRKGASTDRVIAAVDGMLAELGVLGERVRDALESISAAKSQFATPES